jgi:hypothetical protein
MLEYFKALNMIAGIIVWALFLYGLFISLLFPAVERFIAQIKGTYYSNVELKIYLDDERPCPKGWIPVYTYQSCIDILQAFKPTHLSLDHDLGEEKTGYDVVKWIESKTFLDSKYQPPIMTIHSANPAGRKNMELGISSIKRIIENRKQ